MIRNNLQKWTKHLPSLLLVISLCWTVSGSNTNNSPSTPSSYSSVRALDKFGNLQQLTHAREASLTKGRQIVAASNGMGTIIVISLGNKPVLTNLDDNSSLAITCSGVKGDANWLIHQVQTYATTIWERYNHYAVASPAIAHYISRLLLSFVQMHDVDQEYQSGIARTAREEWSRPLGIQTLIVSLQEPSILMIDPSGRITTAINDNQKCSVGVIGKNSDVLQEKLNSALINNIDGGDTDQMSQDPKLILQQVINFLLQEINSKSNETVEFMVEIMTRGGIERKLMKFRNGKEAS